MVVTVVVLLAVRLVVSADVVMVVMVSILLSSIKVFPLVLVIVLLF